MYIEFSVTLTVSLWRHEPHKATKCEQLHRTRHFKPSWTQNATKREKHVTNNIIQPRHEVKTTVKSVLSHWKSRKSKIIHMPISVQVGRRRRRDNVVLATCAFSLVVKSIRETWEKKPFATDVMICRNEMDALMPLD